MATAVRLQLLGSPTVEVDGRSSALPFERRSQLAAYLALKGGWVARGELATLLWPDQPEKLAFANLRKALFRLQSVDWASGVEAQPGALRFVADTDVARFEAAVREDRSADAARLGAAPLLQGFDDAHSEPWSLWLGFERERVRVAWRGAALKHLASAVDPQEAIALSLQLLELDPFDEHALQTHMAWLARHGQVPAAHQAFRQFTDRLARELGTGPSAELQAFHDSLAAPLSLPQRVAPPPRRDGLVGREAEAARVLVLLESSEYRLLTLVGPGGIGKTHLARHALARTAASFPGGTAFADVEDAQDARDIGEAIERAFDLPPSRGSPAASAVEFLRGRRALLVLDNFEHLTAHAELLESLLGACPGLRLLVTSRARLGTRSEQVLSLEGLPWPEAGDEDRIEAFDAVRFFVKAAQRVEPALVPDIEAGAIAEICRRVEGLPLALELAAAWTRVMSCAAIAERLREGSEILRSAQPGQPARHSSMDVVFESSWRLLTAAEREALCRLSVFRGGLSPDAARDIARAPAPILAALVDKSLLRKEQGRLHLHALLHRLAGERLQASGEADATRQAHAAWYLRLLARMRDDVESGAREALRTLDAEFLNVRAAWGFAVRHGMADAASRAVPAMLAYFDHRQRHFDGRALLADGVDSPAARDTSFAHCALAGLAHLEYRLERYAEGEAAATRALAEAQGAARLQALKVLGACCLRQGRLGEAKRWYEQALQHSPARVDPRSAAAMMDNLALVEKGLGRYRESMRLSQRALIEYRQIEDAAGEALCLNNLGALCLDRGDYASAAPYLRDGLALCERQGLVSTRTLVLVNLIELGLKTGDLAAAESAADRAADVVAASGNPFLEAWLALQRAILFARRGTLTEARATLAAAMQSALRIGSPLLTFSALHTFAEILAAQGEPQSARRVLTFCMAQPAVDANVRNQFQASLDALPAADPDDSPWPVDLEELLQRVILERDVAHAPLIAQLRGTVPA